MKTKDIIALSGYRLEKPLYVVTCAEDAQAVLAAGFPAVLVAFRTADNFETAELLSADKPYPTHHQPWRGSYDALKILGQLEGRRFGATPALVTDDLVRDAQGNVFHAGLDKGRGAK